MNGAKTRMGMVPNMYEQVLYLVLASVVKTMSNYANQLFETPVRVVFSGHVWSVAV